MPKKKKPVVSAEELQRQTRERTAQQWIPIADVDNLIYRKDGHLVGILRVQPENLTLLSDSEKRRKVDALAEGFNGETEGFQIFCIGRPVDLNNYLEWLQEKAKMEQDYIRKAVLKGYIRQASNLATSGEAMERRFYIVIDKAGGAKAEAELLTRLNDLQGKLQQAELSAHICNGDEIMDVLSLFANPIQASVERAEVRYDLPAILV